MPDAPAPSPARTLDLAAIGLDARERAVLVSMTRLLDGQAGLRLRWVDDAQACTTLFVPHDWTQYIPPPRVLVRLVPRGTRPAESPRGLALALPIRVSDMNEVLAAATALHELALSAVQREHTRMALNALRDLLVGALLAGERRRTLVGLGGGQSMVIDFRSGEITSSLSQAELMLSPLQLAEPQRAPDTFPWLGTTHTLRLSTLLWTLTHALIDQGVSPRTINGRYQLVSAPEPAALTRPSAPRLVAAWTQRAMGVGEAAVAGGLSAFEILWFLSTALALGIAVPAAEPAAGN
ncbi:hypothetical protein [Piscinibacter sp. HJYY11]|uniref:hypothetical protein n=1 Tax=Piscinibacter sp. HJYY11 TaxID=2801333 RepID=UPI00191FEE08|nr:hypothetical protein [Piscinibacter sp. HJYY11]MBL0727974.1 hypothetical protein [Piscinibacter sp. HJYY11]